MIKKTKITPEKESAIRQRMMERMYRISFNVLELCQGIVLKPNTREMMELYLHGRTLTEIARIKRCSPENVRKVISCGFARLEQLNVNYYRDYEKVRAERDALRMALHASNLAKEKTRRVDEHVLEEKRGVLLADCEMSKNLRSVLRREFPDVLSIQELSRISRERFKKTRWVGRKTLNEVETLLHRFSFSMVD